MKFSRGVILEKVIDWKNHFAFSILENKINVITSLRDTKQTATIIVLLCVNS